MNHNLENKILSNVFTDEQIKRIYSWVESCPKDKIKLPNTYGQIAYYIDQFDSRDSGAEDIFLSIENALKLEYNLDIKASAIQFARYTLDSGNQPWLPPHYDKVFQKPMITVDIQMSGNIDWPVYVNGNRYSLQDNQALVFSGTHQIHWRPKIKLEKDQYLDMIFCHMEDTQAEDITNKHRVDMKLLSTKYLSEYV